MYQLRASGQPLAAGVQHEQQGDQHVEEGYPQAVEACMATIAVGDFLTPSELQKAARIVAEGTEVHRRLKAIVEPKMPLINELTGQENDADYIAYAVEWACSGIVVRGTS
jgi:hypothetical protein